jgi:hypothetical protein
MTNRAPAFRQVQPKWALLAGALNDPRRDIRRIRASQFDSSSDATLPLAAIRPARYDTTTPDLGIPEVDQQAVDFHAWFTDRGHGSDQIPVVEPLPAPRWS